MREKFGINNTLTTPQLFRLARWLEENKEQMLSQKPTMNELAHMFSRDLGFTVTEANVQTAKGMAGLKWRGKRKPKVKSTPPAQPAQPACSLGHHLLTVATALYDHLVSSKQTVPVTLMDTLNTLRNNRDAEESMEYGEEDEDEAG